MLRYNAEASCVMSARHVAARKMCNVMAPWAPWAQGAQGAQRPAAVLGLASVVVAVGMATMGRMQAYTICRSLTHAHEPAVARRRTSPRRCKGTVLAREGAGKEPYPKPQHSTTLWRC